MYVLLVEDLLYEKWWARLRELSDRVGESHLAESLRVAPVTLKRWLEETSRPGIASLFAVARASDYSLDLQLRDLGASDELFSAASSMVPYSSSLIMRQVRHILDALSDFRPSQSDLATAVLRPNNTDLVGINALGRWTARLFDVVSGVSYPHVAFHAIEFSLGVDQRGHRFGYWSEADWESVDVDWRASSSDWIRTVLESGQVVMDPVSGLPLSHEVAWERLELRWRLREHSRLVHILWYGEIGSLHRALSDGATDVRGSHFALIRAYRSKLPDPMSSLDPPYLGDKNVRRIVVIGAPWTMSTYIGFVVSDALAWRGYTATELVRQVTRRMSLAQSDGENWLDDYSSAYDQVRTRETERKTVLSISEVNSLVGNDGYVTKSAASILSGQVYAVLLSAPDESAELWRQRQEDQLPVGTFLRDDNRLDVAKDSTDAVRNYFNETDPLRESWVHLTSDQIVPWWSLVDSGSQPFLHSEIGDHILRASYAIFARVTSGSLPGQQRARIPGAANDSLIRRYQRLLDTDFAVREYWREH